MRSSRRQLLLGCLGLSAAAGALVLPARADKHRLTRTILSQSLALGTGFMLRSQRRPGNFAYQLDWHRMKYSTDDHPVRQAGAAWGLALLQQNAPEARLKKALLRSLAFFEKHAKTVDGGRFIVYPSTRSGSIGAVALVALAHIELLRAEPDAEREALVERYLHFLMRARRDEGGFHASYDHDSGEPYGQPSSYYDGESLLALVKAGRYLHNGEAEAAARAEADASYRTNVTEALADEPDSPVTKGYYQWASMAYYELATWKKRIDKKHAGRLLRLADWILDVHTLDRRSRNTAYAYEGIIPAYAIAQGLGDAAREEKLATAIERGLWRLTTWQVGSPIANDDIQSRGKPPQRALGGVQNHRREPHLRIDVTQHQMHAVILALRHYAMEEA